MRINMNNPKLYHAANELQRLSTLSCLKEYGQHIKWKITEEDTAIDLGCADGSVSVIVKNYAPFSGHRFKKFVASDVNENMIQFASKRYADEDNMSFRVLNIEGDVPKDLLGVFNHVFSFYTLHWVKNQEKGFTNIYNLLTNDGDIFLTLIANTAIYDVYKALALLPKWKTWLKEVGVFVSPYAEMQNPENYLAQVAKKCGFKNVNVIYKQGSSKYDNLEGLKNIVQSVEPFNMPQDVFDELFEDFCTMGQETGTINFNNNENGDLQSVTYGYTLLIISADKYLI